VNPPCGRAARGAISFPGHLPHVRAGKPIGPPCFSPHTNHGERFLGTKPRFMLPTVAPGQTTGVLRIASSVLHILPQTASRPNSVAIAALVIGRKAAQERFSEENFRLDSFYTPETHFSTALPQASARLRGTHGTQQAWMNSRNSTTIATGAKHRQPIFLHPTVETGAIRARASAWFKKCAQLAFNSLREPCLLNPSPASTLKVFHSIERLAYR
jgi:hypothetical protein